MVTISETSRPPESSTVKTTAYSPASLKVGVQLKVEPDNVEPGGLSDTEYLNTSPSISEPTRANSKDEPSVIVWSPILFSTGGSLTAVTVTDTSAALEIAIPSDA